MAGLLSDEQIAFRTGLMYDHFVTFSAGRYLIVHKEPKIQYVSTGISVLAGYADSSTEDNKTLIPVSGQYRAMKVSDKASNKFRPLPDAQSMLPEGNVTVKVEPEARDFINEGKTVMFEFDGMTYAQAGPEAVQNYLGLVFYLYPLAPLR